MAFRCDVYPPFLSVNQMRAREWPMKLLTHKGTGVGKKLKGPDFKQRELWVWTEGSFLHFIDTSVGR